MFGRKGKEYIWLKSEAGKRFLTDIEHVYGGDRRYLSNVFAALAKKDTYTTEKAAEALCICLYEMTFDEIVTTDAMMRDSTSIEWFVDWKNIKLGDLMIGTLSSDERRAIVIFASFHPNGFIREQAVTLMAHYPNTLSFLILRTNDWVLQVRQATRMSIDAKMSILSDGELVTALPFLEKMRRGKRSKHDYDVRYFYDKLMDDRYKNDLEIGLCSSNHFTRKLCIDAMICAGSPEAHKILACLKREPVPFTRYVLYKKLLNFDFFQKDEILRRMLGDKYPKVRMIAFLAMEGDRYDVALKLLSDRSVGIRALARDYIKKVNSAFDFRQFYIDALPANTYASICGIGEVGDKSDANLIQGYWHNESPSLIKAGMRACLRLDRCKYQPIVIRMISDERSGISKQAYKLTKDYITDYNEIHELFCTAVCKHSRQRYADILMLALKWQRLIYIIELLSDIEEDIQNLAKRNFADWLGNFNRSYTSPSKGQIAEILELLETNGHLIPRNVRAEVDFVLKIYK